MKSSILYSDSKASSNLLFLHIFFLQFLTSFHHDLKFLIVTYPACSSVQYYFAPSFQLYRLVRTFVVILLYTYAQIFQAILCNTPTFFREYTVLFCFFHQYLLVRSIFLYILFPFFSSLFIPNYILIDI